MATVEIKNIQSGTILSRVQVHVQTKATWAGAWVIRPYVEPVIATLAAEPTMPSARLLYRYGQIEREDKTEYELHDPLDLLNQYVQIVGTFADDAIPLWTGVITQCDYEIRGAGGTKATEPSGDQLFSAFGLAHLLDSVHLWNAWIHEASNFQIDWMPPFNNPHRHGQTTGGNRSTNIVADNVYYFSSEGALWTHRNIIEYLLKKHGPANLTFALSGDPAVLDFLDSFISVQNLEGLTVRQALSRLIDRRRGLGWSIRTTGAETIDVHVFSLLDEALSFGDFTLPANVDRIDVAIDQQLPAALFDRPEVTIVPAHRYDQIRVQGERIKICCSIGYQDGTLEAGWKAEEEASYKLASEQSRKLPRYDRVYAYFRIPANWNWMAGWGTESQTEKFPIMIGLDNEGGITLHPEVQRKGWVPYGRMLPWLPFQDGLDYSQNPPADHNPSDAQPRYRKPIVLVYDEYLSANRYYYADQLAPDVGISPAHIEMSDREMAFACRFNPAYRLAYNHAADMVAGEFGSPLDPANAFDWQKLVATVNIETDQRLRVIEDIMETEATEISSTLTIEVPGAELWYVLPNTVVGIDVNGALQRFPAGAPNAVRDDTDRLRAVMAAAKAWYQRDRAIMRLPLRGIESFAQPGMLLRDTSLSWRRQQQPASVVSQVIYEFAENRTVVETGFVELDIIGLGGGAGRWNFPEMADQRAFYRAVERLIDGLAATERDHGKSTPVDAPSVPTISWAGKVLSYTGSGGIYNVRLWLTPDKSPDPGKYRDVQAEVLEVHADDIGNVPANAGCTVTFMNRKFYFQPATWN